MNIKKEIMMITESEYINNNKEKYCEVFKNNIKRDGAVRLLEWICSSKCDFFTAVTENGGEIGSLCEHSLKVFECLTDYIKNSDMGKSLRDRGGNVFTDESIAIVSLLHDLYKIKTFKKETDENGNETIKEDSVPYGLAEKSVYMISGFIRITDDEAFAIRYHKGFYVGSTEDRKTIGNAMEKFALAYALSISDMAATFFA